MFKTYHCFMYWLKPANCNPLLQSNLFQNARPRPKDYFPLGRRNTFSTNQNFTAVCGWRTSALKRTLSNPIRSKLWTVGPTAHGVPNTPPSVRKVSNIYVFLLYLLPLLLFYPSVRKVWSFVIFKVYMLTLRSFFTLVGLKLIFC